jgi:hypothetical protein
MGEDKSIELPTFQNTVIEILKKSTPASEIKKRKGPGGIMLDYVSIGYIISQLDEAFQKLWEFEVVDQKVGRKQVWVKGRLTVHLAPNFSLKKEAFGSSDIKEYKAGGVIDIGNDLKSAASDALKKSASLLGIASDIFYPATKNTPLPTTTTTSSEVTDEDIDF